MSEQGQPEDPITPPADAEETLQGQLDILVELLAKKDAELDALRKMVEELLRRLKRCTSEKLDPNQLLLAFEVIGEALNQEASEPEVPAAPAVPEKPRPKRKGHGRTPIPEHLPRETVRHELPEEERLCPCCGEPMGEIGHDICEQLDIVPAKLRVIRHETPKYACGKAVCKVEPGATIHSAERPSDPIFRCKATPATLALLIVDKMADHMPLYRIQDQLARQGIHLPRSTMCDWFMGVADALKPLYDELLKAILESGYVHNDDTTVMRLRPGEGSCGIGRFWVSVGTGSAQYVHFIFTLDRSTKDPEGPLKMFIHFAGFLQVDAYGGYHKLFFHEDGSPTKIVEVACMAHARRYFLKALDSAPAEASYFLSQVQKLYLVEADARDLGDAERLAMRQARSVPILQEVKNWKEKQSPLPKSPLAKALTYLENQWDALNVYSTAGHLRIDNNPAENALRPIAVGRKNWLFVGPGERGGQAAAILYSFVQSCRMLHINPLTYLTDVLTRIMDHPKSKLAELLPIPWLEAHPEAKFIPAHAAGRR